MSQTNQIQKLDETMMKGKESFQFIGKVLLPMFMYSKIIRFIFAVVIIKFEYTDSTYRPEQVLKKVYV